MPSRPLPSGSGIIQEPQTAFGNPSPNLSLVHASLSCSQSVNEYDSYTKANLLTGKPNISLTADFDPKTPQWLSQTEPSLEYNTV